MSAPLLIAVLGPTASGKTAFAATLAHRLDGEVISADSRQVYKKMDKGTGKDYSDYIIDGRQVPYHLIDIVDAGYKYNLFEYQRDFKKAWYDITDRGRQPVLCGGSGMYLESVLNRWKLLNVPLNESLRKELENKADNELEIILSSYRKLHNVSDTSSRKRLIRAIEIAEYTSRNKSEPDPLPEFDSLILGIDIDRNKRRERITERLRSRIDEGMIEEVESLLNEGIPPEDLIFYGLEYKYITLYLTGKLSYDDMTWQLNTAIHQFAKRQMTWFRKMERDGYRIHWLRADLSMEQKIETALQLLK
jgi:tRNA dimethylallyltransferase